MWNSVSGNLILLWSADPGLLVLGLNYRHGVSACVWYCLSILQVIQNENVSSLCKAVWIFFWNFMAFTVSFVSSFVVFSCSSILLG